MCFWLNLNTLKAKLWFSIFVFYLIDIMKHLENSWSFGAVYTHTHTHNKQFVYESTKITSWVLLCWKIRIFIYLFFYLYFLSIFLFFFPFIAGYYNACMLAIKVSTTKKLNKYCYTSSTIQFNRHASSKQISISRVIYFFYFQQSENT